MNPTDLRTELSARAAESEGHSYGDLLPGVQRKIRRAKQGRVATALAGTAAVAALAIGVLPNLDTTTTPDPAGKTPVPQDVIRNGIRFDAFDAKGHPLQTAVVGNTGQTRVSSSWHPGSKEVTGYAVCSTSLESVLDLSVRVKVDGLTIGSAGCALGDAEPDEAFTLAADDVLWTHVRPGTDVRVELTMVDADGKPVTDPKAVLGAGIYTGANTGPEPQPGATMPSQPGPTGPNDYVKDGIRYRAKVAGDTLVAAAVGNEGGTEFSFEFTPATDRLGLRPFCLADDDYELRVSLNDSPMMGQGCGSSPARDAGSGGGGMTGMAGHGLPNVKIGQVNTATVRLTDKAGRPVSMPAARIGLGIYQLGARRIVTTEHGGFDLEEIKEYAGHLYRLDEVRTADATGRSVQIATPAGVPFLVAFGSNDTGLAVTRGQLGGLDAETPGISAPNGLGQSLGAQPSRGPGTATLRITEGEPTKGKLVIATYTPLR